MRIKGHMKQSRHIFIYIILICIAFQGTALSRICVGKTHCDARINWAEICHSRADVSHETHDCTFDHDDAPCVDIPVSTIAGSGAKAPFERHPAMGSGDVIKAGTSGHPFAAADGSRHKTALFPVFPDTTSRSIASTILII